MRVFVSHVEDVTTPMGNKLTMVKWQDSEDADCKLDPLTLLRASRPCLFCPRE